METVKIKYLGENPTRIAPARNAPKVDVKKGEVVEVDREVAVDVCKAYKNTWVPADTKAVPKKAEEAQVEGGLDEDNVDKAVPKKAKK